MEQLTPYYLQKKLNELLDRYFDEFVAGKRVLTDSMPEIQTLINSHFETNLTEALTIDYTSNKLLIKSFYDNIYKWSLVRTYKQTKEITDFIYKNKGNINEKNKTEFLTSSKSRYNSAWLDTELRTFNNTVQNVNNWDSLPNGKDVMLRYSTANDERVRHSHALLDNLTMKKSDPRWSYLYPPPSSSPYNCRCRVVVVYDQPESKDVNTIVKDLARVQKQTVAQVEKYKHPVFSGKLFNENESYFQGIPKKIKDLYGI